MDSLAQSNYRAQRHIALEKQLIFYMSSLRVDMSIKHCNGVQESFIGKTKKHTHNMRTHSMRVREIEWNG